DAGNARAEPAAGAQEVQPKADVAKAEAKAPSSTRPSPASGGTAGLPPGARFTAVKDGIDPSQVEGTGRRGAVTKEDLANFARGKTAGVSGGARPEERVPMTRIRKRI